MAFVAEVPQPGTPHPLPEARPSLRSPIRPRPVRRLPTRPRRPRRIPTRSHPSRIPTFRMIRCLRGSHCLVPTPSPIPSRRGCCVSGAGDRAVQSTRSSRGLGRSSRPAFAIGRPSSRTMSAVKSLLPVSRAEPTP